MERDNLVDEVELHNFQNLARHEHDALRRFTRSAAKNERAKVFNMFFGMKDLGQEFTRVDELVVRIIGDDTFFNDLIFVGPFGRRTRPLILVVTLQGVVNYELNGSPGSNPQITERRPPTDIEVLQYTPLILEAMSTLSPPRG